MSGYRNGKILNAKIVITNFQYNFKLDIGTSKKQNHKQTFCIF